MPHIKSQNKLAASLGNTIVEYALIGLILLVCIGGITLIGTNWNGQMLRLKQDMQQHNLAAANAQATQQQQMANAKSQPPAQTQPPPPININNMPVPPSGGTPATVQTAGGNGTEAFAQDILANAKKALDSGSLSQDEYDIVARLANKGHDIATIQGLLENAYQQSKGNASAYAGTQLTFNGQSYTPSQLNALLETNISDFGSLKSQASVQNGVLYNQDLLTSINDSGAQIINNGYFTQQQNQSADSFIQYQSSGVGGGSSNTHEESATICTNGQHLDSGNHCVP